MPWLVRNSARVFQVGFRFAGKEYRRSLKTNVDTTKILTRRELAPVLHRPRAQGPTLRQQVVKPDLRPPLLPLRTLSIMLTSQASSRK